MSVATKPKTQRRTMPDAMEVELFKDLRRALPKARHYDRNGESAVALRQDSGNADLRRGSHPVRLLAERRSETHGLSQQPQRRDSEITLSSMPGHAPVPLRGGCVMAGSQIESSLDGWADRQGGELPWCLEGQSLRVVVPRQVGRPVSARAETRRPQARLESTGGHRLPGPAVRDKPQGAGLRRIRVSRIQNREKRKRCRRRTVQGSRRHQHHQSH